jgi:23S rRNA pseudouridine955/2504/2580 synthase
VKHIIGGKQPQRTAQSSALPFYPLKLGVATTPAVRIIEVDAESAGQRLDNFLLRHLKGVPKTHVYRIIRSGEVRVNKGRSSADARIHAGDLVRVPPLRLADSQVNSSAAKAPAREFPILMEDDDFIAIDKPAGVAVHGGSGVSSGVIEQLRQARPEASYLELVHRLDRDTSGILLIAKKRSSLVRLQDQFRDRETGKTYLALVSGEWPSGQRVIDIALHKYLQADGERRVRTTSSDDADGMRSITLAKPIQYLPVCPLQGLPPMTIMQVTIKTGRTHQIRVHMASQGHPIVGDDKYGDFDLNKRLLKMGVRRMFLHAWRLQFNHPQSAERITLFAPWPQELSTFAPLSAALINSICQ